MAPRFEDLPYRPCVGVMLVNRNGMVFIGQRMPSAGPEHVSGSFSWQISFGSGFERLVQSLIDRQHIFPKASAEIYRRNL